MAALCGLVLGVKNRLTPPVGFFAGASSCFSRFLTIDCTSVPGRQQKRKAQTMNAVSCGPGPGSGVDRGSMEKGQEEEGRVTTKKRARSKRRIRPVCAAEKRL